MKTYKKIAAALLLLLAAALMFVPLARFGINHTIKIDKKIDTTQLRVDKAYEALERHILYLDVNFTQDDIDKDRVDIEKLESKLAEQNAEREQILTDYANDTSGDISYSLMPAKLYTVADVEAAKAASPTDKTAAEAPEAEAAAEGEAEDKAEDKAASEKAIYPLTDKLILDNEVINYSQGSYTPNLSGYRTCVWAAFIALVIAALLLFPTGNKIKSKFYTISAIFNLIGIVLVVYSILRVKAFPIDAPYTNAKMSLAVCIPMIVMPIFALIINIQSQFDTKRTMIYILCIFLCILSILPFWIMMVNATRSSQMIQQGVSLIPSKYFGYNWQVLQGKNFDLKTGFLNSAIIAFGSTILSVYFSALTAYGLTVYNFKGRKLATAIVMAIIMIPTQVTGTGFYIFMYQLGWTNSYLPLIIPAIAAASTVYFFRQYLQANFQVALVEAARIDGAGEFFAFNKIIMPIMIPAMATMGIMAVIGSWNNYLTPLMLLTNPKMKTLPMMVKELRGDIYKTEFGSIYLGLTMTALPLIIVYFALSKYIIAGIAVGGVKE